MILNVYCRGSIFSLNLNKESWKEKENIREKIYAVFLQPASDQHVHLHNSLFPAIVLLINVKSGITNLLLKYPFLYFSDIFSWYSIYLFI